MDACYGRNVCGYSWADDDDDEFDMEHFKATAANFEYYSNSASGSDEAASAGDKGDGDDSSPATHAKTSDGEDCDYSDCDIPPRPSTPEPSFRGDDDDDPGLPAHPLDWSMAPGDDVATTEARAEAHACPYKKLPAPPEFYLQVPFEYDRPPGLPPNTLHDLEYSAPWKPAYEALMFEDAHSYAGAYRNNKVQRGVDCRKMMLLRGSPLRQEVKYEEETDDAWRQELELEGTFQEEIQLEEAYQEDFDLEEDISLYEAATFERWEMEQAEEKKAKTFEVYKDEIEAKMGVQGDIVGGARDESNVAIAVATSCPIIFTMADELAHEAQKAGDLGSASANDSRESKKHDSVHEEHDTSLFLNNENPSRSTTPESLAIASTDEEIDVVKDSPFFLPLDKEPCPENGDEDNMRDALSRTAMEEEQKDEIDAFFTSAVRSAWSLSTANDTAHESSSPHKLVVVLPIAHVKGLRGPVVEESAITKIIRKTKTSPAA
ncbi:uncharacterized protein CC84DRAFT_1256057 [Paraphaeosphaeria sporulosa]|uniref:Uncharacterized protein n=1 Tax=Paraphaeosphaeria sporulosa TaxID=1460663 RepID=A0A177CT55_9PLEO|nr:uncharacterized protein CC84DRAFT_1256057 [Paraphaeosphaeria sporulosa]OAG10168.1 hypothetical protein CC84DRAFT_1256057 [Paraphaeosphaeria sporulosa]